MRLVLLATSALGTAALVLVSPTASPAVTLPWLVLAVGALAALVVAERRAPVLGVMPVLVVAGGLLLLAVAQPPHGSRDLWSYAMYGRILGHHHANPYLHAPAEFPTDALLQQVAPAWRGAPMVYGPGFGVLAAAVTTLTRDSVLATRVAFQGLAAAAVFTSLVLLARRRVPVYALAAVALNPVIVLWLVNGGHNDALVGLALLGAALALRRHAVLAAGALFAAAVLVKAVAAFPLAVAVVWLARRRGWRPAVTLAGVAAAPVTVAYLAFGGWAATAPLRSGARVRSRATLWSLVPIDGRHVGQAALVVVAIAAVALARHRWREPSPVPIVLAGVAAFLLASAYVLPWYLGLALPLAALDAGSIMSDVLFAQSAVVLFAYEYQVRPNPTGLDRLLGAGVGTAQVLALLAVVAAVALGLARPRLGPARR